MHKNRSQSGLQKQRDHVCQKIRQHSAVDFFNVLTGPQLLDMTQAHLPEHRERLYSPTVVLSMFIRQSLDEVGSCQRAVNGWAAQRTVEGLSVQSIRTGAYCRARQRLPLEMVTALVRETGELLCAQANIDWRFDDNVLIIVAVSTALPV